MELPEMIKHSESVRMISMGGATEASIWSNYYEVESVKDGWTSIPYGKPLTNQKFYVLDQEMNDCPNWVQADCLLPAKDWLVVIGRTVKERRKDSSIIQLLMRDCIIPVI